MLKWDIYLTEGDFYNIFTAQSKKTNSYEYINAFKTLRKENSHRTIL